MGKGKHKESAINELVGAAYRLASEWREDALCMNQDEKLWFDDAHWDKGKAICETCPVKLPCLLYAMRAKEEHGVWGGFSPRERRKLARSFGA